MCYLNCSASFAIELLSSKLLKIWKKCERIIKVAQKTVFYKEEPLANEAIHARRAIANYNPAVILFPPAFLSHTPTPSGHTQFCKDQLLLTPQLNYYMWAARSAPCMYGNTRHYYFSWNGFRASKRVWCMKNYLFDWYFKIIFYMLMLIPILTEKPWN